MTRGHRGALLLRCRTLSFLSPCRFIPALQNAAPNDGVRNAGARIVRRFARLDACMDLGTEWGEYLFETSGKPSRSLIQASRLLRQPDHHIALFGKAAYDTMFADCLWHVYGMIGKFNRRVYLLTPF